MNSTITQEFKIKDHIVYELCIETTKLLKGQQKALRKIKWTHGESNIDTEYCELACNCCKMAWCMIKQKYPKYTDVKIVCSIPDINIVFVYPNGEKENKKIELKSSKSLKMPGSTIGKLDINQPLIYCLRSSQNSDVFEVRCSQYHNAMWESKTDLFQDRTPRPFINFEKMKDPDNVLPFENKSKKYWIEHYAKCAINRISGAILHRSSWQNEMIKIIKRNIIEDYIRKTPIEQIKKHKKILKLKNN